MKSFRIKTKFYYLSKRERETWWWRRRGGGCLDERERGVREREREGKGGSDGTRKGERWTSNGSSVVE